MMQLALLSLLNVCLHELVYLAYLACLVVTEHTNRVSTASQPCLWLEALLLAMVHT